MLLSISLCYSTVNNNCISLVLATAVAPGMVVLLPPYSRVNGPNWDRAYRNNLPSNTYIIILLKGNRFPPIVIYSFPQNAYIFPLLISVSNPLSISIKYSPSMFLMCNSSQWKVTPIRWSPYINSEKTSPLSFNHFPKLLYTSPQHIYFLWEPI